VQDPVELVREIASRYREAAPGARVDAGEPYSLHGREPSYRGEFWVVVERERDGVRSVSHELRGKARRLAGALGEEVGAVLACDDAGDRPAQLIAAGADRVYVLEHPLLASFDPLVHKKAIAELVMERQPQVVLFGATPLGRELAPRVAYACRSGLTADCTRLEIGDVSKGGLALVGVLEQTRPALGGIEQSDYERRLEERGVLPDLRHARNYRQSFRWGSTSARRSPSCSTGFRCAWAWRPMREPRGAGHACGAPTRAVWTGPRS
jgi:hypothetical protein